MIKTFAIGRSGYKLYLKSDEELRQESEILYDQNKITSKIYSLDSSNFGANRANPECYICHQNMMNCPGHYGVIKLPFPIVKNVCLQEFKKIIQCICPICSNIPIKNISDKVKLINPEHRLKYIKNELTKMTKNGEAKIRCPCCNNDIVLFKVLSAEPHLRVGIQYDNEFHQINWIYIDVALKNFKQIYETGFYEDYHPKNFMTSYLPIVPNKLRSKNLESSDSVINTYYLAIINEMIPELNGLYNIYMSTENTYEFKQNNTLDKFNTVYDKMYAYYTLITNNSTVSKNDELLSIINRQDKTHVDPQNSLMMRIKGKQDETMFNKGGIIGTRHNVSCRTVLGGAVDSSIRTVNIPFHYANRMGMTYPVFEENLNIIKQMIYDLQKYNDDKTKPKVLGIFNEYGNRIKITPETALDRINTIKPGDRISISLLNNDLVMQSRFPSVREESWCSYQVKKDNNTVVTLPLPDCMKEMADFDGDETQVYCLYSHYTIFESLLLHSIYAQFLAYKNGNTAVWFEMTADTPYGLKRIKPGVKINIFNNRCVPEYDVVKKVEEFIPNDLNYRDDSIEIKNGHIISEKIGLRNQRLFKYIAIVYGTHVAASLMDNLMFLAYDLNKYFGNSIGYEAEIKDPKVNKKVEQILDTNWKKIVNIEKTNKEHKEFEIKKITKEQEGELSKMLLEANKGSNLEEIDIINDRQTEIYQIAIRSKDVEIHGEAVKPVLADGFRTSCAYAKNSLDPEAYGHSRYRRGTGLSPSLYLFELEVQRYPIFVKGKTVAKQGYLSRRLDIAYGSNWCDHNGGVMNPYRNVSICYNSSSLNPRYSTKLLLPDINMQRNEFIEKYHDDRLLELYDRINEGMEIYRHLTKTFTDNYVQPTFTAGLDYDQFIDSNGEDGEKKMGEGKNKTGEGKKKMDGCTKDEIDDVITRMRNIFCPPTIPKDQQYILSNFDTHEYYFRIKLLNKKLSKQNLDKLVDLFMWTLVDAGEPVGTKACLAVTEPLTQAALHAIHKVSGGSVDEERLDRSTGVIRFEELFGGSRSKNTIIKINLYDNSRESCKKFANEQETFYFNDLWKTMEMRISNDLDPVIAERDSEIPFNNYSRSNIFIKSIWNLQNISGYDIHVVDVIDAIMKNYEDILFIDGYVLNATEFMALIYFKSNTTREQIENMITEWKDEQRSTIIHGKYLKNCYVSENKNKPGEFVVEANIINDDPIYTTLLIDERIDPYGTTLTDTTQIFDTYGIFEASARTYEELCYCALNLSDTSGILTRHYKLVADAIFVNGYYKSATRLDYKHNREIDSIRLIQYETPRDFVVRAMNKPDKDYIADPVSSMYFAENPECGSGVSKITLYPV